MWYFATVLFGFLFADQSLGWFGASHRMLMALHTFVWLYFFNLLPSISRCTARPHDTLLALMRRSIRFSTWASIYGAFLLTVLARPIMSLAFGAAFAGAGTSMGILAWMLPVAMLSGHYRYILIAYHQQNRLLWCTVASAVVAVLCGFALVPTFGAIGAASALLIANITNLVLVYREVTRTVVAVPFLGEVMMPVLGLAIAGGLFLTVSNIWVAAGIATLGYALLLARVHGRDTLRMLKSLRNPETVAEESMVA
jgi:O-antigen/teichoic acid export membrane protein